MAAGTYKGSSGWFWKRFHLKKPRGSKKDPTRGSRTRAPKPVVVRGAIVAEAFSEFKGGLLL
jgi:hypothetical protein